MNILIQEHPEVNLLPLMNCLGQALGQINLAVFNAEVDPAKMLEAPGPNIIFYHGDMITQNVHDLLVNANCALVEHVNPRRKNDLDVDSHKFSIVDQDHENYFAPACNTFLLQKPELRDKFTTDVAFIGPPSRKAMETLSPLLDLNSEFRLRIYGENQYKNWRYCGIIQESDISHIYRSTKTIPVFNSALEYDFRVLDCIYAGGIPLCEENPSLVKRFGPVMTEISFEPDGFVDRLNYVLENRERILEDLKDTRRIIREDYTWYNIGEKLLKAIGLKRTAKRLEEAKAKQK